MSKPQQSEAEKSQMQTIGPTETTKGITGAQQVRIRELQAVNQELEEVNRRMTAEIADAHTSIATYRAELEFHKNALADLRADRKYQVGYAEGLEQALLLIFGGGHPLPPVRQQQTRPGPESL